ncbi:MAG: hypothetical protein AB7O59_08605 [Pirellulales bacterium]
MRGVFATATIGCCLLLSTPVLFAQQPGARRAGNAGGPEALVARLMMLDVNGDGKLSKDEMSDPRVLPIFARADADGDGFVTREELAATAGPRGGAPGAGGQGAGGQGVPGGPRGPNEQGPPGFRGRGPGGPGGPPQIGQVLPEFVQEMLALNERQKKRLAALQKEVDTRLANKLTEEQKQKIAELQSRGPGGSGGPGAFGPPDGPPPDGNPPQGPRRRVPAGAGKPPEKATDKEPAETIPE